MGSTYVIQSGHNGPVKIGYTDDDPRIRMRALQIGSAEKLYLVRDFQGESGERHLHRRFAHLRLHGEWFSNEVFRYLGGDMYEEDE